MFEPMFPDRANDRDNKLLVGLRPRRMIKALDKIFELSLQNPLLTYISGDTGSGKSHILNHMKYIFTEKKSHQIVILNANDFKRIDESAILRTVHQDIDLNRKLVEIGGKISPCNTVGEAQMINEINNRTKEIGNYYGGNKHHGLIIAIDGLDEYVRKNVFDAERLLITLRLLLDDFDRTCILLSLTHNIYEEIEPAIRKDRTFLRRFIGPQEYDGSKLNFMGFNLDETYDMYEQYKIKWLERLFYNGNIKENLFLELKENEWPISKDAISLIWESTNQTPGILQKLFQRALDDLIDNYPENWLNPNKNITPESMASTIETFFGRGVSGMKLKPDENLKNKIAILKDSDRFFRVIERYPFEDVFIQTAVDLLKKQGFSVGRKFDTEMKGCYIQELSKQDGSEIKKFALGFFVISGKNINYEEIEFLNKFISKNQQGYEITYILIVTIDGYKDIYEPWNGPIDVYGPFGHNLGNYTYTIPFDSEKDSEKIQCLMATYKQRDEKNYSILLEIADKKCCNNDIMLSDILESICNSILYYKGQTKWLI